MALVQLLGIQATAGPLRRILQGALVDLRTAQLIDRQVQRMADHLQTQARQVLQLAGHRLHGGIRRIQRVVVQVAGAGHHL
ncbi:hypothetical protein D9M71_809200 [compost metagenome]